LTIARSLLIDDLVKRNSKLRPLRPLFEASAISRRCACGVTFVRLSAISRSLSERAGPSRLSLQCLDFEVFADGKNPIPLQVFQVPMTAAVRSTRLEHPLVRNLHSYRMNGLYLRAVLDSISLFSVNELFRYFIIATKRTISRRNSAYSKL